MKNKLTHIVTALVLASTSVFSGESTKSPPVVDASTVSRVSGTLSTGYANEYLWRGTSLGEDLLFGELELSYDVTDTTVLEFQGFYGSFDSDGGDRTDEVDGSVGVRQKFGNLTALGGYSIYDLPDAFGGTQQELYGGFEYELPYSLTLGATYNFSLEDDLRDYTEVSLSAPFVLVTAGDGSATQFFIGKVSQGIYLEDGEAVHTTLSVLYNASLTKSFSIAPFVEYNFVQDEEIAQEDGAYWGIKALYRF